MYQGRNPTAVASQSMMVDALGDLMKQKAFKDITVSELCRRAQVSRQTFYSLFGSKENILLFRLGKSAEAQRSACEDMPALTLEDVCRTYGAFVVENYDLLGMLVENDLAAVLNKQFAQALYGCEQSFVGVSAPEKEYVSEFLSAGLCRLACRYIERHPTPDRGELEKLAYKAMSGSVYRPEPSGRAKAAPRLAPSAL